MSLNCGIIGLTNTGKTAIFNCMSNTKAISSNYAFSATKSNIGIVNVPDPRLYKLDELVKSEKVVPALVEIVDVPGLAKGASEGEGVGNKFLASPALSLFFIIWFNGIARQIKRAIGTGVKN